jgi:hypothetical protein
MTISIKRVVGIAFALSALVLPASAFAASGPVAAPTVPGAAGLPGPLVDPGKPAQTMLTLKATPDIALAGTMTTITGAGLPANKDVQLTWSTATIDWVLDARPDSIDYLGRKATKFPVLLTTAHTDASGAFKVTLPAPHDWGGLHDIYAVVDGVQVAKGGFLIARHATMTPKNGPIGTPITITYSGLGSQLYEGSVALNWDNHFTGQMTANWTRGVAVAHIRASGPVGRHVVYLDDAVTFGYMNIPQSPNPWAISKKFVFTVTKDTGRPAAQIDWPMNLTPTVSPTTTLDAVKSTAGANAASAALSVTSGKILTKVDVSAGNLTPNAPVILQWATVVGNRVNCTGICWAFSTVPLGTATAGADGTLKSNVTVPDGLGGWHAIQVVQNGKTVAQAPFFVKRSFASAQPVSDLTLHQGQHFTVHLKGVGWTQLDNTVAVTYDNGYVGYGCGFNSQGDVLLDMVASGEPGTHLIDMYPLLYTQQPSYPNTPYGMIPMLSYRTDMPGLALGYKLPAMRLAITVVK